MNLRVWGARGSVPAPGPETMRYGGNTSCVQLTLSDGTIVVLDAGTGIRTLGLSLPPSDRPLHILLTHLHLDHIQGLMFFAPMFRPESEIVIYGPRDPSAPGASLRDRIARYISAPLTPVEIRELPCHMSFREAETTEWQIGPARGPRRVGHPPRPDARLPRHRGRRERRVYIPDHEPGARHAARPARGRVDLRPRARARRRPADPRRAVHRRRVPAAPRLGALVDVRRRCRSRGAPAPGTLLAFHHDPLHSDDVLDEMATEAQRRWSSMGGSAAGVELATESTEIEIEAEAPASAA